MNEEQILQKLREHYIKVIKREHGRNWKLFMLRMYDQRRSNLVYDTEHTLLALLEELVGTASAKLKRKEVEYSLRDYFSSDKDINIAEYIDSNGYCIGFDSDSSEYLYHYEYTQKLIEQLMI